MTQEQKDILLKDLCARLPYGVAVKIKVNEVAAIKEEFIYNVDGEYSYITNGKSYLTLDIIKAIFNNHLDEIKPYLFPLSSMTAEQKEFIKNKFCYDWDIDDHPYSLWTYCIGIGDVDELIDWFHKNHIDYRGLIPMGLANDATGLNIY
jgi:hypothetical protein